MTISKQYLEFAHVFTLAKNTFRVAPFINHISAWRKILNDSIQNNISNLFVYLSIQYVSSIITISGTSIMSRYTSQTT